MTNAPLPDHNRDERTGLVKLTEEECTELLAAARVGRIVFLDGDQPMALPVNYGWFEDTIVFRTGDGQKLDAAVAGQRVAFEVDRIDDESRTGVSVVVTGQARAVDDWAEQAQLEQLDVRPWQRKPWRKSWVRVTPTAITGRRLDAG